MLSIWCGAKATPRPCGQRSALWLACSVDDLLRAVRRHARVVSWRFVAFPVVGHRCGPCQPPGIAAPTTLKRAHQTRQRKAGGDYVPPTRMLRGAARPETGCARPGCKGGHARSGGDAGLPSCAVRPELPLPRVAPSDTHWVRSPSRDPDPVSRLSE